MGRNGWVLAAALATLPVGELSASAREDCLAGAFEAEASDAPDSRTIALKDGRSLRLAGIETFALLVPEASEAETAITASVADWLRAKPVRVRLLGDKPDRYGRLPALVGSREDRLLQEELAARGLAIGFHTGQDVPCFARVLAAEDDARRRSVGFWAEAAVLPADPDRLAASIGRFAIVEGVVISVGNRRAYTYLNFGAEWSRDVTARIAAADRDAFGGEAQLSRLAGRRVRVRGFLEERGGPLIELRGPAQIEVLGEGSVEGDRS